jgi:hypothetical protein
MRVTLLIVLIILGLLGSRVYGKQSTLIGIPVEEEGLVPVDIQDGKFRYITSSGKFRYITNNKL